MDLSYEERCKKYNPSITAVIGVIGAVIDIYILVIPIFFVWALQISRSRKAGLAAIFLLGSSYVLKLLAQPILHFHSPRHG